MTTADPRGVVAPATRDAGAGCKAGGRCGGVEWVQVTPAYAERLFPLPPQPSLEDQAHAEAWAKIAEDVQRRRAAALDSWYPCRDCNGRTFHRWLGRHFDSAHVRAGCPECELAAELSSGRRRRSTPDDPPATPKPAEF